MKNEDYPVFRKYPDHKSFFKIASPENLVELKITGKTYSLHQLTAKILPERNLIQDILEMKNGHWLPSTEKEFEEKHTFCKIHLREI